LAIFIQCGKDSVSQRGQLQNEVGAEVYKTPNQFRVFTLCTNAAEDF